MWSGVGLSLWLLYCYGNFPCSSAFKFLCDPSHPGWGWFASRSFFKSAAPSVPTLLLGCTSVLLVVLCSSFPLCAHYPWSAGWGWVPFSILFNPQSQASAVLWVSMLLSAPVSPSAKALGYVLTLTPPHRQRVSLLFPLPLQRVSHSALRVSVCPLSYTTWDFSSGLFSSRVVTEWMCYTAYISLTNHKLELKWECTNNASLEKNLYKATHVHRSTC